MFSVRSLSAQLHQGRAAALRSLLRGTTATHIRQRSSQPAAELARAAGNQVQEAAHLADNFHGRKHEDSAGRLGDDCQRTLPAVVEQDRARRPVRVLAVHRTVRQGRWFFRTLHGSTWLTVHVSVYAYSDVCECIA